MVLPLQASLGPLGQDTGSKYLLDPRAQSSSYFLVDTRSGLFYAAPETGAAPPTVNGQRCWAWQDEGVGTGGASSPLNATLAKRAYWHTGIFTNGTTTYAGISMGADAEWTMTALNKSVFPTSSGLAVVKYTGSPGVASTIVGRFTGNDAFQWRLHSQQSILRNAVVGIGSSANPVPTNVISVIGYTYNSAASTLKFFLDGVLTDTITATGTFGNDTVNFGCSSSGERFQGFIGYVQFFSAIKSDLDMIGMQNFLGLALRGS